MTDLREDEKHIIPLACAEIDKVLERLYGRRMGFVIVAKPIGTGDGMSALGTNVRPQNVLSLLTNAVYCVELEMTAPEGKAN